MLTPEQLASCADEMVRLYAQLDEEIVRDIARRIVKTGTMTQSGRFQFNALQDVGLLYDDILKTVSSYTGKSDEILHELFEDAALWTVEYDMEIYTANGLNPISLNMSPQSMQILEAGYQKTKGNIANLTRTTAATSQTHFINACTLAEMKVESGAFSYDTAIMDAIKQIAKHGTTVIYPSGHEDKLDVAIRRNVMTGLGQTTGQICLNYAKELGCDLMEITAHCGARPSHASWQGQIVSLSGKGGYLSLSDIGYGTGDGFKGWNCRHDWYPYFEGSTRMYSESDLEELNARNIEYPDGTMHTYYEAEQHQRAMERRIRETKRQLSANDELIKSANNSELKAKAQAVFDKNAVLLKKQEAHLSDFCNKTGLLPDKARTQAYGFGRSTAQKAVQRDKALYRDYQYYMGTHALSQDEFRTALRANSRDYRLYQHVVEVNKLYKTDFGSIEPYKIYELDQRALTEKRTNFTSAYKHSGNFAVLEYDGEYYYAHSQANTGTTAYKKYKGDKAYLATSSINVNERCFDTFAVEQSTGRKLTDSSATARYNTFEDTEAKLFESLEKVWYNTNIKEIYMLSERGMCDSCKYVAEQFMKKHPDIKVNIVSGKLNTGDPWKGRKPYA